MACLAGLPGKRLVTLSKKDMTEQLMFAELNLNKPCDFWDMTFGQIRPKSSTNTSYQLSSGGVKILACFAAKGPLQQSLSQP